MKTKNILTFALIVLALASCKKESTDEIKPDQKVTYTVDCDHCLVYVEDNHRNASTGSDKHFVVDGHWEYEFINKGLDSVTMRIYVGSFAIKSNVIASIRTNDGKEVVYDDYMGFNPNVLEEPYDPEKSIGLRLKNN